MYKVRVGVFETNSSSTHSVSLGHSWADDIVSPLLPKNEEKNTKYLDIKDLKLKQDNDGAVRGSANKLAYVIALICEIIKEDFDFRIKKQWVALGHKADYNTSYYKYEYRQLESGLGRDFVHHHKYIKLLNELLEKRLNIKLYLSDVISCFPYISESISGCRGPYYKELGLSRDLTDEQFIKKIEEIIFDDDVVIEETHTDRE